MLVDRCEPGVYVTPLAGYLHSLRLSRSLAALVPLQGNTFDRRLAGVTVWEIVRRSWPPEVWVDCAQARSFPINLSSLKALALRLNWVVRSWLASISASLLRCFCCGKELAVTFPAIRKRPLWLGQSALAAGTTPPPASKFFGIFISYRCSFASLRFPRVALTRLLCVDQHPPQKLRQVVE
jgi:hypothetical protein